MGDLPGVGGGALLIGCGSAHDISHIPWGWVPTFCKVSNMKIPCSEFHLKLYKICWIEWHCGKWKFAKKIYFQNSNLNLLGLFYVFHLSPFCNVSYIKIPCPEFHLKLYKICWIEWHCGKWKFAKKIYFQNSNLNLLGLFYVFHLSPISVYEERPWYMGILLVVHSSQLATV